MPTGAVYVPNSGKKTDLANHLSTWFYLTKMGCTHTHIHTHTHTNLLNSQYCKTNARLGTIYIKLGYHNGESHMRVIVININNRF